jgi:hypothetical protein
MMNLVLQYEQSAVYFYEKVNITEDFNQSSFSMRSKIDKQFSESSMKSIKISRNLIAPPMSDVGEDVSTRHKERERERDKQSK